MPAVLPSKLNEMTKASDRKQAILNAVGDTVDKLRVFNNQLLIGTYIGSDKIGNIYRPDNSKGEDVFMGTLGLVLKKGPTAFMNDAKVDWMGQNAEVGEWVLFRYSAAWEFHLNGASVRLVDDIDIRAVVDCPDPGVIITSRPIKALGG